jgi:serine phosphatase RsbU (regulator of sigma subunit)
MEVTLVEVGRLQEAAAEIRRNSSIARSLPEAQRRQLQMLPKPPAVAGFDFDCRYIPCDGISGDFYDFVRIDSTHLGIAIGDVSGHGIEAAMVMGMAKKALQIFARDGCSPKEVLALANRDLSQDLLEGTFVSAAYGILDIAKHTFTFGRAGNNPPFLVNPNRTPQVTELKPNGLALGVDKTGARFGKVVQELAVQLKPGDLVFQYTDGVVEAQTPAQKSALKRSEDEQFGEARLKELLLKCAGLPISMLLGVVEAAVRKHAGGQALDDDITMIAFKVLK